MVNQATTSPTPQADFTSDSGTALSGLDSSLLQSQIADQILLNEATFGEVASLDELCFNPMDTLFQDIDFYRPLDLDFDDLGIPPLDFPNPTSWDPSRGYAAFQRSPWLCEAKQEKPTLPVKEELSHFTQDDHRLESWIHAPSFHPDATAPELVAAVISSGATFTAVPTIWQFGLAMQEIVRVKIFSGFEESNAHTRDLKALQAFMMCLDVGMWSGRRDKLLRQAAMFSALADSSVTLPLDSDPSEVVEEKWQQFITHESYKRLALHVFTHDVQTSIILQKNPLITFNELSFRLPASRDLWSAPTADAWRQLCLSKSKQSPSGPIPRVFEVMHNLGVLDELWQCIDVDLCYWILLHGFWGQIHAYRESIRFYATASTDEGMHCLWLKSQHQELYHGLCAFSSAITTADLQNHNANLSFILDLFLMVLHVSLSELQLFAGMAGEEEAHRAAAMLEHSWVNTAEARHAVWYAGQVFLRATRLSPANLDGFNAIAVYLASLTLWAYGTLRCATPHQTDGARRLFLAAGKSNFVLLNGEETRNTKAFLHLNKGMPALVTSEGAVEPLSNPPVALAIARRILRDNISVRSEPLLPLVESLDNLLRDL
ncbi:c6 zinc finger domain containing protein [Grosmannia clavigera kw1407]|uniref:C6 zinc finger domain containing protein n=1 Tax=Grosmannia clavigera (strain kw1407 / UAMH 11150) TaxID=655863 RepID=F0XRL2_GROCL|nr:c6 zinc finger domain containing protein [Grosmannia clavigera kw1407]EFW99680.1 c6 zinc finger domain containing protein [Grosmannia clavigera kw1407]